MPDEPPTSDVPLNPGTSVMSVADNPFPLDGSGPEVDEAALAESLLPADAELVGRVALGTTIAEFEGNTLWHSASLAERFASMGEPRGGEILVVYTYEPMGPAIQRVELRTLALAEEGDCPNAPAIGECR